MSKICRTCLQKTNETFKTTQTLGDFGDGSLRISMVLRFCIPELYLGLSANPEICFSCKENLKVAYLFKKKCLNTENIIGDFLKNARSTGKCVELHDVLAYLNDRVKMETQAVLKDVPPEVAINYENLLSNWEEVTENETVTKESPQIVEIRQSVPNSLNHGVLNPVAVTSLLSDNQNLNFSELIEPSENSDITTEPLKEVEDNLEEDAFQNIDLNDICKIQNVFSVSDKLEEVNKDNLDYTNTDSVNNEQDITEDVIDIKDEPLDIEMNNVSYNATDEDTLDASETASYQQRYSPTLQRLIDNAPAVNHPDQYVDIPDLVTINKFGLKELEQLRLQQHMNLPIDSPVENSALMAISDSVNMNSSSMKPELKIIKVFSQMPEVIILNGKKMVKCGNGYKVAQEETPVTEELKKEISKPDTQGDKIASPVAANISISLHKVVKFDQDYFKTVNEVCLFDGGNKIHVESKERNEFEDIVKAEEDLFVLRELKYLESNRSDSKPIVPVRKRIRRKIKIVPVSEEPVEKKIKLETNSATNVKQLSKIDNKSKGEVVVLFTNYTWDGLYINDHDYLMSPYRRNKVLIEEDSGWMCMCYICSTKHEVYRHVQHMVGHGVRCMVCYEDLGTPYMLNIHYKSHRKSCRYCTEIIPLYMMASHEEKHFAEEEELNKETTRRTYSFKKGKRKISEDEKAVYFPIPKNESHTENSDSSQSQSEEPSKITKTEIKPIVEHSQTEDLNTSKKSRGRPRRKIIEEDLSDIIESPRVLRARVKKWYAESDEDESVKESLSGSKGAISDLKSEEN